MAEDTKTAAVAPIAPEAEKPAAVVPDPNAERMNLLARKEQAIRKQYKQFQAEKAAYEAAKSAPAPKAPVEPTNWDAKLAENPMDVIKTAASTIEKLQAELADLRSGQNKALDDVKASQQKAYDQAVKQVARDVKLLTDGNDLYEAINAQAAHSAVVELIKTTYQEDGILLSAEEAANQVEDYLTDEAMKLSTLKKVKAKLAPPTPETSEQKTHITQKTSSPTITTKTLTHAATVANSTSLSAKDRKQRAILAFQNQLK
jgi:hypothetical protein